MRARLKLEALDARIVPGSNSIRYGQETNLTGGAVLLGSNTDKLSEEVNLMGGSKPSGAVGSNSVGDPDTSIVLLSSDATGGHGGNAAVDLFGGRVITGDV